MMVGVSDLFFKCLSYQKKFKKLPPSKLYELLECNIITSAAILRVLSEKIKSSSEKNGANVYNKLRDAFHLLVLNLTHAARDNKNLHLICYEIASCTTKMLMQYAYKSPTEELRKQLTVELEMPFLISPWNTDKKIKEQFKEISKQIGLAKAYGITTRSRFSSVPTRIVFEYYRRFYASSLIAPAKYFEPKYNLPPLREATFTTWWKAMEDDFRQHFEILQREEPKYYNDLKDDRGDKTPIGYKRKRWMNACRQALEVIEKAKTKQTASGMSPSQKITQDASRGSGS